MPKSNNHKQKGFTIIELLVATTVFSIVLIVFLSAFLRISQLFYKGVSMSRTQESARNVMQDVSDDIQFYHQTPQVFGNYFCVGIHRYTVYQGIQVGGSIPGGILRETTGSNCPSLSELPVDFSKAEQLLDSGMQVNNFSILCPNGICDVKLRVVFYGSDNSVLISPSSYSPAWQAPDAVCSGPANSSQYCATADYETTILQS